MTSILKTPEAFAVINKLSTLARVASNDLKSLPQTDFYPYSARFLSTTDNINHTANSQAALPRPNRCAVCIAGAVLVRTFNLPVPPTDIRDAYATTTKHNFHPDPDINQAIKSRIMAIEYMRVGDFQSAFLRIQPKGHPKPFPISSTALLSQDHMGFSGWKEARLFLADWDKMTRRLETKGY